MEKVFEGYQPVLIEKKKLHRLGLFFGICAVAVSFYSMQIAIAVLAFTVWMQWVKNGDTGATADCLNGMIEQLRERITDLESEIESMKSG